jgi:hypothetical protein
MNWISPTSVASQRRFSTSLRLNASCLNCKKFAEKESVAMTGDLTLSHQVQSFLDTLDWEDDYASSPEKRDEMQKIRAAIKLIVDDVRASRETLIDNALTGIEKLVAEMSDEFIGFLDDRYTREVVDAVPGYVKRTMQLSRLESSRIPSKITNGYLQEVATEKKGQAA